MSDDLAPLSFRVTAQPHPLRAELIEAEVAFGCTLAELGAGPCVLAWVDERRIDDLSFRPHPGSRVLLKAVPQGFFDNALGFLISPFLALTDVALGYVTDLIGSLIPLPSVDLDLPSSLQPFGNPINTSNRGQPFGPIPRLYGTHRIFPPLAALPYTESAGDDQYLRMLFCLGYGPLTIDQSSIRLGDTPLTQYEHQIEIRDGAGGAPFTLFSRNVVETSLTDAFNLDNDSVVRTASAGATELSLDFAARALIWYRPGKQNPRQVAVGFRVEFRLQGAGAWTLATAVNARVTGDGGHVNNFPLQNGSGTATIMEGGQPLAGAPRGSLFYLIGKGNSPHRVNIVIPNLASGTYELRVTRDSAYARQDNADRVTEPNDNLASEFTWTALRAIGTDVAQTLPPGLAMIALRIKTTDQLSGVVNNLSVKASSRLQTWNGAAWVEAVSSNPAWVYRDVLIGSANARPLTLAKVDDDALKAWGAECAAAGREFNGVFDGRTTVFEALKAVAIAGRASFQVRSGKFGAVRDVANLTPVQLFTPRNSAGFIGTRSFASLPHALKIKFKDRDSDWQERERIVYADGYSLDGAGGTLVATEFEQLALFGFTSSNVVWKEGRYRLAVSKLRPETFQFNASIDNLVCARGQVIRHQHDALLVGLGSGRIKAIAGSTVTLDEEFTIEAAKTYQLRIRKDDATQALATVSNAPGISDTLTLSGGVPAGVQVGDLAAFGETGKVTQDLLIIGIAPSDDLRAAITAVPYGYPGIADAETGTIPPYDPLVTRPPSEPPAPVILNVNTSGTAQRSNTGSLSPRAFVSYLFPSSPVSVPTVEAEIRSAGTPSFQARPSAPNTGSYVFELADGAIDYVIRLRGISAAGLPGPWTEASIPAADAVPNDLAGLTLIEQRNNPATPNRDLSTVVATVAPPAIPGNYSHSIVEYRKLTQAEWFEAGPTDAAGQARAVFNSDGSTYEFRARAVSTAGYQDTGGPTAQITLSTATGEVPAGDPDAGAIADAALNVANLRVLGQLVAVTDFTGQDAAVQWDAVVPPMGQTLRDYRVRIIDPGTGNPMRVVYIVNTQYRYTLAENTADSLQLAYTTPRRQITVELLARTTQGRKSATPAGKTIQNPAPVLPGDFTHGAVNNELILRFTRPSDGDYVKAQVYVSTVNGFTAGPSNLAYDGAETNPITISGLAYSTTYYYRVQLYDQFGAGALSAQFSSTTGSAPGADTTPPTLPGTPVLTSAVESAQLYTVSRLTATWTASTDDSGSLFYEVEHWTTDSTKTTVERTPFASYTVTPARAGVLYSLRLRAIDYSGNASAWTSTATHTVAGDTTAPANVTGTSATPGLDKVVVEWTNPTDADFLTTLVYRGTSSGFTANASSLVYEGRGTIYVDAEVVNTTSYWYKFATKDVSGNTSTASAAVGPATPNLITSANIASYIANVAIQTGQIADQAINVAKFASGLTPVEIVSSLPGSGNYVGRTVFLTTDSKLYRWTGSAWTAAVPAGDLTGQITGTQIADNSISTPKLQADSITANEIAANAVTASELAANSVIAGKIAAGVITATEIAANAIATDRLAVGDFTNFGENADFEFGDRGWKNFSGSAWSIVNSANARRGSWHAQITNPSGTKYWENLFHVSVESGNSIYASAWIKFSAGSTGNGTYVAIDWYNAAGSYVSSSNGTIVPVSATSYALGQVTGVAPATASTARISIVALSTTGTCYADDAAMHRVNGSALILDASIITAKIADLSVVNAKIGDLAVSNAKINDLDAVKITAGFISAARIQASTITADKLNVTQLSAIAADMGSITAGTITGATIRTSSGNPRVQLDSSLGVVLLNSGGSFTTRLAVDGSGYLGLQPGIIQWNNSGTVTINGDIALVGTGPNIRSGKASYSSSASGFFLGNDSSTAKFHIGSGAIGANGSKYLLWDGSEISLFGDLKTGVSGSRLEIIRSTNNITFYGSSGGIEVQIGPSAGGQATSFFINSTGRGAYILTTSNSVPAVYVENLNGVDGIKTVVQGAAARGFYAEANSGGTGVYGLSGSGIGVLGSASSGGYGVRAEATSVTTGASLVVLSQIRSPAAPTHQARRGSIVNSAAAADANANLYFQEEDDGTGSGNQWVNLS